MFFAMCCRLLNFVLFFVLQFSLILALDVQILDLDVHIPDCRQQKEAIQIIQNTSQTKAQHIRSRSTPKTTRHIYTKRTNHQDRRRSTQDKQNHINKTTQNTTAIKLHRNIFKYKQNENITGVNKKKQHQKRYARNKHHYHTKPHWKSCQKTKEHTHIHIIPQQHIENMHIA